MAAALAVGVSLFTALAGGFRLQVGFLRVSSGSWWRPLIQAGVLGLVAAWFFYRDASLRGEWDTVPRAVARWVSGAVARVRQQPLLWTGVLAGAFASLLVCYGISTEWLVVGSREGRWTYDFVQPVSAHAIAIAALVSAIGVTALMWRPRREERSREWALVCAWIVLGIGLQALLRSLTPFSFEQIFLSEGANSFYTVTQQHDAASVLADFNRLRDGWPLHAHSNLPGKLILLYALELISGHPAVLAWLVVVVSNLGGALLYVFVRDLFADRRAALFSLVLYLFVPGKLFFFPLMNTVTPTIAFACAVLVLRWLQTRRTRYAVCAGVALFGLVFFEPLPLVGGVLFAMLAARALWRGDLAWRRLLGQSGALVFAFLATWAAVRLWLGFDLFDAFQRVAADAAAFNANEGRLYGLWVRQNAVDFLFSAGACQAVLFCVAFYHGLQANGWRRGGVDRPVVLLCAALVIMLVALDLVGINRGEVVRLWIFLACLFQVPAAYVCAQLNSRAGIALVLATAVLQGAVGTSMIGFVVP